MARLLWVSVETPDRHGQGGQRRQYHQIKALHARGHGITVVAPAGQQSDESVRKIADVIRPRAYIRGRRVPFGLTRVHRLVRDRRWDAVVISHHGSAWLVPDDVPHPVLLDLHNIMSHWFFRMGDLPRAEREKRAELVAISVADRVSVCSAVEADRLVEMHPSVDGRVLVAALGIDPDEWPAQAFTRDRPRAALFGGWGWVPNRRGLDWFVHEVWPRVIEILPTAEAVVAGTGVPDSARSSDRIDFVGRVADLARFTADAAVVAVPVIDGVGASMKFVESLASGANVIATPDGASAAPHSGAFVSTDPAEWADWIAMRLERRRGEPIPAVTRQHALTKLTWSATTAPIDEWLAGIVHERTRR